MGASARFAVGIVAGLVLGGTSATAETLEEALASAYQDNPELKAARAELRAVDEQVPQARAGWRPSVTINNSAGRTKADSQRPTQVTLPGGGQTTRVVEDTTYTTPANTSITLEQPIWRGGRTTAQVEAAQRQVRAQRKRLVQTEQEVLLDAAEAYLNVVRDKAVVRLNENNRKVLERRLEAARNRFEVGENTRTDVSQAEARVAGAKAETIQARGDLQASRATYEKVVGHLPEDVSTPDMPDGLPESKDALVEKAIDNNPQVGAARHAASAARRDARAVKGELLPTLSLEAQASRAWERNDPRDRYTTFSATASLTIPLYQSGAVYSRLREARETVGQRRMEGARARRAAAEQAASAWENLQAARASLDSIKAQIEAAEVALEGVKREAQVGARTTLDVLDAEQELLDARVSRVKARRNALVAAYRVLSAKGALTAEDLGLSVTPYQPEKHYKAVESKWFGGSVNGADE